jgi:TonB family protein
MKPLQLILTALLLVSTALSYGQRNEAFFYSFDENWKDASADKAKYFIRRMKVSDTCWQWDTYNMYGPMIKSEQFIDEKGSLAHGRVTIFNEKGKADSICSYSKGNPNGKWYIFTDPFYNIVQTYNMGVLVDTKQTVKVKGTQPKDSVKSDEKESEYPGGLASWQRYLNRNLTYPKRAINAHIMGSVTVSFTIDTVGNVEDCYIYRSVEFSLDEEALRIIRHSHHWIPAKKNSQQIISYKRQPIIFRLPN